MKKKTYTASFITFWLVIGLLNCNPENVHYKNHEDIEGGQWFVKNEPTFSFEIPDSTQTYNVYYLVRNAIGYPYYNLYVKRFLLNSENKTVNESLNELILMDDKTGKPLGDGLGDLFDHKIVALKNYRFPRKGKYTLKVRQYMRQDPLLGILSMGISVEKATN